MPQELLQALTKESLEAPRSIALVQQAMAMLYKALLAGQDSAKDMRAANERLTEYRAASERFAKRLTDHMGVGVRYQIEMLKNESGLGTRRDSQSLDPPSLNEKFLVYMRRFSPFVQYLREIERKKYQLLCAVRSLVSLNVASCSPLKDYLANMADLEKSYVSVHCETFRASIRQLPETDEDAGLSSDW